MTCTECGSGEVSKGGRCHPCHLAARRVREREANRRLNVERRERYASDPEYRQAIKDRNVLLRYGLTPEVVASMLEAQNGLCAICATDNPGARGWAIDHDHACCSSIKACGQCIRGLLCNICNLGLGQFKDDPALLIKAAHYLNGNGN